MRSNVTSDTPSVWTRALQDAETQLEQAGEDLDLTSMLLRCGTLCRDLGKSREAESYLSRALHECERCDNVIGKATTLIEIAYMHTLLGNYRTALEELRAAHLILRSHRGVRPDLYAALAFRVGSSLRELGYIDRGVRCLQLCYRIAHQHSLINLESIALSELAEHLQDIEEPERQRYREDALALLDSAVEPSVSGYILSKYRWTWNLPDGLTQREEAYRLAVRAGGIEFIIRTANTLSNAYWRLNQPERAAEFGEVAIELAHRYGYKRLEALCSSELAIVVYRPQGRYDRAKSLLERAISLREQMIWRQEQRRSLAAVIGNLGSIYKQAEELDRAYACFKEAYSLHEQRGTKKGMRIHANNIGTVYHRLGRWKEAEEWYGKARKIAQETLQPEQAARAHAGNLASLYQQWARESTGVERAKLLQTALNYVNLTLEDQSKRRMARNLIFNAGRKGQLLVDLDRPQEALPWLFRSYRMSRRFKRQKEPTKRMTTISHAYLLLDKPNMAHKAATIGIAYARRDPEWAWSRPLASAYGARAKAWLRLSNTNAAIVDYQRAGELLQESYRLLEEDETGLDIADRVTNLYTEAIGVSYKVGRLREAFHFLEMSRQPVFRQRLAATHLSAPSQIPKDLIDQERVLLEMLSQGGVASGGVASIDDDEEELEQRPEMAIQSQLKSQARRSAKQQIEAVWSQMRNYPAAAEYVALRKGEAISYQRLLNLLAGAQPRRIVVAAFYVTEAEILVFGVSADWHDPKVEEIPIARSQLHTFVKSYIDRLDETSNNRANSTRATLAWFDQEGSALLSQLIAPLLDWTEPGDYIYLVPHDLLHHLPLHAVKVNGTYLIERNPVLYSQSVSILEYCVRKRKDQRRSALILADSRDDQPIVFAREQAHAIGELFAEARTYVGPTASLGQLIDELRTRIDDIDVLHLAVHGAFSHRASDESGIDLADGRLTPEKLLNLSMRVDLVTMSACDSGAGKYRAGDEMIGLTRALIYAGTPSVVSSLWTVDALSTSIMMREFYTALLEGQQTKAEALQHAQLHVKNLTARAALTYAERARAQLDGDARACTYLDWTIAEIQFVAHDYAAAQTSYQVLLDQHEIEESIAKKARVGLLRARLAATRPISTDYDQRVYADLYNWAPFVLVGDWR